MHNFIALLWVVASLLPFAGAFQSSSCLNNRPAATLQRFSSPTPLKASEKEEEIANLEEQLRKLREEAATEEDPSVDDSPSLSGSAQDEEEVVPESMFLSEEWKETESEAEGSTSLTGILGAVGLALFLALFSQVPIGQEDLSKYSAIKAPTEQIDLGDINRARQSGDL